VAQWRLWFGGYGPGGYYGPGPLASDAPGSLTEALLFAVSQKRVFCLTEARLLQRVFLAVSSDAVSQKRVFCSTEARLLLFVAWQSRRSAFAMRKKRCLLLVAWHSRFWRFWRGA